MIGRDGWAGLVVLALCAILYWLTLGLKGNPLVPIGPEFYPRIVLGISAVLAALLVVVDALAHGRARRAARACRYEAELPAGHADIRRIRHLRRGAAVPRVPHRDRPVRRGLAVLLERPRGAKGWAKVLVLALVAAAATYAVFEHYLTVLLPRGKWTGW